MSTVLFCELGHKDEAILGSKPGTEGVLFCMQQQEVHGTVSPVDTAACLAVFLVL